MRRTLILVILLAWGLVASQDASVADAKDADVTVGLVDVSRGQWHVRDGLGRVTSFYYGNPGDVPFMGDWNCDSIDTPGLFRTSDAFAYLRNSNTQGIADVRFFFGNPSDVPLAGDFNGDGCDTLSIYRPSEQRFYIMNKLGENNGGLGAAEYSFIFGNPGDKPVVGDWDGDGVDEVGLHRESSGFFYYRNTLTTGIADGQFFFGDPGDRFVAGDWGVVDGKETPGLFRPSNDTFFFRHTLTQGNADSQFTWTGAGTGWIPVAGVFALDTGVSDDDLVVTLRDATGMSQRVVTVSPAGKVTGVIFEARGFNPHWSPNRSYIGFLDFPCVPASDGTGCEDVLGKLTIADRNGAAVPLGSPASSFTADGSFDFSWAPDSRQIVIDGPGTTNGEDRGISIIGLDGSGRSLSNDPSGQEAGPRWSPDGNWIAWRLLDFTTPIMQSYLLVRGVDGSPGTTKSPLCAGAYAFAPVGRTIVWCRANVGGHVTAVLSTEAGDGALTPFGAFTHVDGLDWSLDGSQIAFRGIQAGDSAIWVVNADGTGLTALTAGGTIDVDPVFSPDGTRIAYTGYQAGYKNPAVYAVSTSGGAPKLVIEGATDPDW